MENIQSNNKRIKGFVICGMLLLSALSAFWTLSGRPLNNHECFVSITAREMLESGDWVWPTCNAKPRLQKTPLSYWLVAGSAEITGGVDEFTARLPSAVLGVLSAAAILYFVNRWLTFRTAVISAGVWITSLGYIRYTHNARPEMALTFFILLCFLTFYSAITARDKSKQTAYTLLFWVSFALANLAKGPAPLPLVLLPLFFYVTIFRKWKKLFNWASLLGIIIFLAIVLPWPLAIANRLNWDLLLWKQEFIDRFFGEYDSGSKVIYYYLPRMFMFIVPWVAFLPMALAAPFFKVWNKKRPVMQFLWLWFVIDLLFLTVAGGKRQHYILPLMPAMAILIGILLEDMAFAQKAYTQKYARDVLRNHIVVILIGAAAAPIYVAKAHPQMLTKAVMLAIITIAVSVIVAVLFSRRKPAFAFAVLFTGIIALAMTAYVTFINPLNYNRPSRQFTRTVAEKVPPSEKLIAYKSASMRFVNYFGSPVLEINNKSETRKLYNQGCWVVAFGRFLDELLKDDDFEIVYKQAGAERHKGQPVDAALLHK